MPSALGIYDWYLIGYADGLMKTSQPGGSSTAADTAARIAHVLGMRAGAANEQPVNKSEVERQVARLNS